MIILFLILLAICTVGIKFNFKKGFDDYISPQKCNSIKGIFISLVVLSHVRQFIKIPPTGLNKPFLDVISFIGQLMVVMFLFYSGYGIALGLKNKKNYTLSILTQRIPSVLLHFDIAVIIYFILGTVLGAKYSLKRFLLSLICLDNVGNVVWYIFVILILYLLTFAVFIFFKKNFIAGTAVYTVVCAVLTLVMYLWKGNNHWWYDTIMCFPLGMWFAVAKPAFDKAFLGNLKNWLVAFSVTCISFILLSYQMQTSGRKMIYFIPASLIFAILITLLSMKLSVNNKMLHFLGSHLFGIYILHFVPMKLLTHFGLNDNPIIFSALSFVLTLPLAFCFEQLMSKLDVVLKLSKKR